MDKIINFYDLKNSYGEFSNFYPSPITIDDIEYPTVEHFYQSKKFMGDGASKESLKYAKIIAKQSTPGKAKILANQKTGGGYKWRIDLNKIITNYLEKGVKIRDDWEEVKEEVMYEGLEAKFSQHENLKEVLLSTRGYKLVEHTPRDFYWGDGGDGTGKNRLGKLLVILRKSI
jgi:N-glycosidase YbiA